MFDSKKNRKVVLFVIYAAAVEGSDMSSLINSTSHKGEKRRNYTMELKREAIGYAENHSNHKAADKFNVAVKRIREWRQNKSKIFESTTKRKNKRL